MNWVQQAVAAEGHKRTLQISGLRFDMNVAAEPWSSNQLLYYKKLTNSAAFGKFARQYERGYRWEGPPSEIPDWRGIKWDTAYFIAYQFVAICVLYIAPEKLSGWTEQDKKEYDINKWEKNVKNPIWDKDEWWVNYILHPYWGATYYIRGRERGFERTHSFWYAVLLSTLYEYGAEALFEPVSYQDLVVTPVAGSLLGEFLFTPIRARIRAKSGRLTWADKAVLFITDPLGVVSEETSRILGVDTAVSLWPRPTTGTSPQSLLISGETMSNIPSHPRINPVWGVQINIRW